MRLCGDSAVGKCPKGIENWKLIGRLDRPMVKFSPNASVAQIQVVVEFPERILIDSMTFKLVDYAGQPINGPFNVEVKARPGDVIRNLNPEYEKILNEDSLFAAINDINNQNRDDVCVITGMRAFTQSLLVRFSMENINELEASRVPLQVRWRSKPEFYGVTYRKQSGPSTDADAPITERAPNVLLEVSGYEFTDNSVAPESVYVSTLKSSSEEESTVVPTTKQGNKIAATPTLKLGYLFTFLIVGVPFAALVVVMFFVTCTNRHYSLPPQSTSTELLSGDRDTAA